MVRFSARRSTAFAALFASGVALGWALPAAAAVNYSVVDSGATVQFQHLNGGTQILQTGITTTVNLPFPFRFYDQVHQSVLVSEDGFISFAGGTSSGNQGIPRATASTAYPETFIAPWWDSLSKLSGTTIIRTATTGTAPSRRYTVEWRDISNSTSSTIARWSMQVTLFESTHQIRLAYSKLGSGTTPSLTGSVGIQETWGSGIGLLGCTTSASGACNASHLPQDRVIDFFLPPDLTISNLGGENTGYAGVPYRASVLLKNQGGRLAQMAKVRFYLSTDAVLDSGDAAIGDSTPLDVSPLAESLVAGNTFIPSGVAPGSYWLIAQADPDGTILELNESNNTVPAIPLTIGPPTPDLVVSNIATPMTATPGQTLTVTRTIRNTGNAAGPDEVRYTYLLSANSVVTISDMVLGSAMSLSPALAAGGSNAGTDMVTLPTTMSAGRYWLGICVDYDPSSMPESTVSEVSEYNNCASASSGFVVNTGMLAVITTSLDGATQYSPYGLRLQAAGGDGSYTWSLAAGTLPPGMELTPAGDLSGTPSSAGAFSFDVKVSSAGEEKIQALSLAVTPANLPLAIVDQQLPVAEFSRLYEASLLAIGGKPPYIWTLKDGSRLPAGLALATDGRLEGQAKESGTMPFSVELTDSVGTKAAKDLELKVVTPVTMQIATSKLQTAVLGEEYRQLLQAVGGSAPYQWAITGFQKLAENPTEAPGAVQPTLPEGFGLSISTTATNEWMLAGTPNEVGTYAITLTSTDRLQATDVTTLMFRVTYARALAITTTALPDAFVGQDYAAGLSHNGGRLDPAAVFSVPCIQQVDPTLMTWSCAPADPLQALPAGLELRENGELRGIPELPEALGEGSEQQSVTYSFLVKVEDSAGRQDIRSLSIKLRPAPKAASGGCASAGVMPSALALLGLLGLSFRRGRRR